MRNMKTAAILVTALLGASLVAERRASADCWMGNDLWPENEPWSFDGYYYVCSEGAWMNYSVWESWTDYTFDSSTEYCGSGDSGLINNLLTTDVNRYSCFLHDECYERCGGFAECNATFYSNLNSAGFARADDYYEAVSGTIGQAAYDTACFGTMASAECWNDGYGNWYTWEDCYRMGIC